MSRSRAVPLKATLAGLVWVLAAGGSAAGGTVVETWAVGEKATWPGTVKVTEAEGGAGVIQVDLSRLGKGTKIHRARLLVEREPLNGSHEEALMGSAIFPLKAAYRPGRQPQMDDKPLDIPPPWYDRFDATDVVRRWAAKEGSHHGLYVKSLPKWTEEGTRLEITYEGKPKDVPRQATGLKVFHGAGQTFITFKEIEDPFGDRPVTWGELRGRLAKLDEKRIVRYRVYRHTKPITADSVAEAELLAEVRPLSGFNVNSWSKERLINQTVFGDDDMGELGKYGPFSGWDRDSGPGGRLVIPPFVLHDGKPLPPGTGLYVHSATKEEKAYYAVVTSVDGTANTADFSPANRLAAPVAESPAPWQPVLQKAGAEFGFDFPGRKLFYVTWVAPPLANVPYRYFNWSVHLPPGGPPPEMTGPSPLNVSFHDLGFSYAKPIRRFNRAAVQIAGHDFDPVSGWYGYHECLDTLRGWTEGEVRPYTERRLLAFMEWAAEKWKIDRGRCFTDGRGLGGTGAIHFACKHPGWFAYVLNDRGAVCCRDSSHLPALEAAWGRVEWQLENDQGANVWDWQDLAWFVRRRGPAWDLPVLSISPWGHTAWGQRYPRRVLPDRYARWRRSHRDFTILFQALMDNRHMFFTDFDWGATLGILPQWMDVTAGPVPAFTNSTNQKVRDTEDGPFIFFEPSGSSPSGWIHWNHRWQSDAVDRPDRLEMTLYVTGGREVTADVTFRRARKFTPKPGQTLRWSNTCLAQGRRTWELREIWKKYPEERVIQRGTVTADEHGLVTIKGVIILPTKNRIVISRVEPK